MRPKLLSIAAAVGLLIGTTAIGFAQSSTVKNTPGHKMQQRGPMPGHPGASGYSPGHQMQKYGSKRGYPGASGYAPGRATTGQR